MKKWIKETLQIEAKKHNRRTDFAKKSDWAYKVACKMGILDEICSHMAIEWEEKWNTLEKIQKEASKYGTRKEFVVKNGSAYNAARRLNILDQVCSHMPPKKLLLTIESVTKEALKYERRFEFQKSSRREYMAATRLGILDLVCSHMEVPNDWTKENIYLEMSKYTCRNDFIKYSKVAYSAAIRLGMLGEMDAILGRRREHCTVERIFSEAKKYKYRSKFQRAAPYVHRMAIKLGILDEVCSHMKRVGSIMEEELIEGIRSAIPSVKKYRDQKVKILGKEYIKCFEIDIFFKDGMRGIEFDGTYHHSLEGLRWSHPTWLESDLKIYHEIKDSYFKSKGIFILHITEQEWRDNKDLCIERAIAFLSVGA